MHNFMQTGANNMPSQKFSLMDNQWTHLGSGRMDIHPIGCTAIVATGMSPPAMQEGLPFESGLRKPVETSENVYARSYLVAGLLTASGDGVGVAAPVPPLVAPTLKRRNVDLLAGESISIADLKFTFPNQLLSIEVSRKDDNAFVEFTDDVGGIDEDWQDRTSREKDDPPFHDAMKWKALGGEITLNVLGW
jgi:hypothetical protein